MKLKKIFVPMGFVRRYAIDDVQEVALVAAGHPRFSGGWRYRPGTGGAWYGPEATGRPSFHRRHEAVAAAKLTAAPAGWVWLWKDRWILLHEGTEPIKSDRAALVKGREWVVRFGGERRDFGVHNNPFAAAISRLLSELS